MPYQLEPAIAVLRDGATRVLIADAVGAGKTVQAGVILAELQARNDAFRGLVLVPAGLRDQWRSELVAHFTLDAVVADARWLRDTVAERPADVNPWSLPGIYVASHDFVKRAEALRPLEDVTWDLVIVDEAHHAGTATDRRAAIDAIASRSSRVVLLTATPPVEPADFDALCRIGLAGDSGEPPLIFARARSDVDAVAARKSTILAVNPSPTEARMHALLDRYTAEVWREATARNDDGARLASIVLRKRALSSAWSLAASVERRIALLVDPASEQLTLPLGDDELDDDVRAEVLGAPGLADGRRERRWLSAIGEAARSAAQAETKLARLARLLDRIREPVIVFTEYRDTLARIHRRLSTTGRSIVVLHGGMDPAERSRVPRAFEDGALTLLATDAAAEGLNLHHRCRIVIHYELPWNPSRLEQRAGRVDRVGQSRRVHEIALVAASTAERLVIGPLTMRAPDCLNRPGRARMISVLTESRVAESVMAGVAGIERHGYRHDSVSIASAVGFSEDAGREVERLTNVRALIARSGDPRATWTRRAAPFVTRSAFAGTGSLAAIGAGRSVALLYSISLETEDLRTVHEEIVVLAVPAIRKESVACPAAMRALVEPCVMPSGAIADAIDAAARRAAHRVAPAEARRRQRLDDRLAAIERTRRPAAQMLLQPALFGWRGRRTMDVDISSSPAAPASNSPEPRVRTMLVAAILMDRARGSA